MWTVESETVKELCARRPLAMRVLERHDIDPTERARLAECCAARGIEVATVLAELTRDEVELAAPWRSRPMALLLDHIIQRYHRPFDSMVTAAEAALDAARPPSAAPSHEAWEELGRHLAELRVDMEDHISKQERVLFPWLRGRPETAAAPIRAMQLEHADTLNLVHAIHTSVRRYVAFGPCGDVASRIEQLEHWSCEHIQLESNELFPGALAVGPPRG